MFAKVAVVNNVKCLVPLTKEETSSSTPSLDSFYPIGYVYTQFPQQEAPSSLFPDFTWTELNYDGAFFRSSGGNADAFISTGTLTPQGQATAKNNLKITKSGGVSTGHIRSEVEYRYCAHTHPQVYLADIYIGGSYYSYGTIGAYGPYNYAVVLTGETSTDSWNHRHYYSFTPSVSDDISATISGDSETRPINYTIKIWARTA